jgi:hypothetical protein
MACGQEPPAAATHAQPAATTAVSSSPPVVHPLSRAALLQWGADCGATRPDWATPVDPGNPITCFADEIPSKDLPSVDAACQGLALQAHNGPSAMLSFDREGVTLNCDQGSPHLDRLSYETYLRTAGRGQSPTPNGYAGIQVRIPLGGTSLSAITKCDPNGLPCLPLTDGQQGVVRRGMWYYEQPAGETVPVVVDKPSVKITVTRSYTYNHGEIEQRQMLADERALVRALDKVDTSAGFQLITSTAHPHD